jgi:hypothetical protein
VRVLSATELDPEQLQTDAASPGGDGSPDPAGSTTGRKITVVRYVALALWFVGIAVWTLRDGVAVDRTQLLAIVCSGLLISSIGKRRALRVLRDWLPFAVLLLVYDYTRGIAALLGRPTEWYFQVDFDRWLFGGTDPTVWLQSQLKQATPPWWEVLVSMVYVSYYIAPYVVAGVWWLRDRTAWKQFVVRFVAMSFIGLAGFILMPAAPPWAAAQCTAPEIAGGQSDPPCIENAKRTPENPGILEQRVYPKHAGAVAYVERISNRGWDRLGLGQAKALVTEGQASVNLVAAVPSLHAATTLLISVFLWPRVRKRWRPLLVAYPLAMAFVLVYGAEHYVFDIVLGWLVTVIVTVGEVRGRQWYLARRRRLVGATGTRHKPLADPDTLD